MPKHQSTAGKKARGRQTRTGEKYTEALREVTQAPPETTPTPRGAKPHQAQDYLHDVVVQLKALGWGAGDSADLVGGRYVTYPGPVALEVSRDVGEAGVDVDPDDPQAVDITAALYLFASCPASGGYVGDFEFGAKASDETAKTTATRLDAELAPVRLRRVREVDEEAMTSCPICGDRYPAEHLLPNCDQADPVCPACIFDQDQPYRTDLPYLAVGIDRLLHDDLAAPAGWSGVAALLGLTCGSHLGRRLERELRQRSAFPVVFQWWDEPMQRSWIWLPPPSDRHEAFRNLGAGATVSAVTSALVRHIPTLEAQAKQALRVHEVRWRPSLLPAAIAYAVAFSTQAVERDRHRKPVHVVDSTGDGLSQIMKPFGVAGDASNVEDGVKVLLEELLFPLLLGHGLRDEPSEPRRGYQATEDTAGAKHGAIPSSGQTTHDGKTHADSHNGDVHQMVSDAIALFGSDGPYGPLPRVPHGRKVHELADQVRALLVDRGFEFPDEQMEALRDDIAQRGQQIARMMRVEFPFSLHYLEAAEYVDAIIEQSGLIEPDPSKLVALYPVPTQLWAQFTRAVPGGLDPADVIGPADRHPLDWPAPMDGAVVLSADFNEEGTAINLLLQVSPSTAIAKALKLE